MRRRNQSADERPLRPDAFIRQAMGAWGGSVWRLALAQTGSKEDAEDVYQDVFLRLAQSATEFSSQEHLKAWLLRVAVNRCHDVARLRSRRPAVPLDSMPFEPSDAGPWGSCPRACASLSICITKRVIPEKRSRACSASSRPPCARVCSGHVRS